MTTPNFQNRMLYHGDNLQFLRGMNSETIDLIATDPPFNKNRDFHATPDSLSAGASFQDRWSWRDDLHDDWIIQIQKDHPEVWHAVNTAKNVYGDDMGAFLCWLGVRLLEMRRLLKPTGSIYLHIDHTAHAYVKALMDAVFGRDNFRNQIVWRRSHPKGLAFTRFASNHDVILAYGSSESTTWNPAYSTNPRANKQYNLIEKGTGRRYQLTSLLNPNPDRPNLTYEFKGVTKVWRWTRERMEQADQDGLIVVPRGGNGIPRLKRYLDEQEGIPVGDTWDDIPIAAGRERLGYPTQKPLALYERIIKASSNPGDWVLDPFCGCATTPVAAEKLGRKWVGMDIWDKAHDVVLQRMADNRQLLADPDPQIHYSATPPTRTDGGDPAVLYLQTPTVRQRHPAPRTQHPRLLADIGAICQGCGRNYSFDPRVLEVDHIRPRSDGGSNAYDNLTLLCPPCNKEKRDRVTLTGLQELNRRTGHLTADRENWITHGGAPRARRRRRR